MTLVLPSYPSAPPARRPRPPTHLHHQPTPTHPPALPSTYPPTHPATHPLERAFTFRDPKYFDCSSSALFNGCRPFVITVSHHISCGHRSGCCQHSGQPLCHCGLCSWQRKYRRARSTAPTWKSSMKSKTCAHPAHQQLRLPGFRSIADALFYWPTLGTRIPVPRPRPNSLSGNPRLCHSAGSPPGESLSSLVNALACAPCLHLP